MFAVRFSRLTMVAAKEDQGMTQIRPFFSWEELDKLLFDFFRRISHSEAHSATQSEDMRIDRNSLGESEPIAEHDVRRFSTNTG